MEHVIQVENLIVDYKEKRALDGLSLSVRKGEIFGFLGPNGAGKSTTIKALLGLIPPSAGRVLLHGLPAGDVRSRARVGFLPEEASYYRFLSPVEILTFYGEIFRIPRNVLRSRIQNLLERMGLAESGRRPLGTFSKGMAQKVGLAQALINEPETLVLDEPTSGLDPLARMELRSLLSDLRQAGKTIFFSSHELSEVELLCDSVAILKAGRLVRSGSLETVLRDREDRNLENFFLDAIRGPSA